MKLNVIKRNGVYIVRDKKHEINSNLCLISWNKCDKITKINYIYLCKMDSMPVPGDIRSI